MVVVVTKASLPPAKERLVKLMQEVNFGYVEDLAFRKGEPIFDPPPRVIRVVKLCAENGPRPEVAKEDFVLKGLVCDLFGQMKEIGDGIIRRLDVQSGLPIRMHVEENSAA